MNQFQRRKSLRHPAHDYKSHGYYYLTICSFQKSKIFGEVVQSQVSLSSAGEIVLERLKGLSKFFPQVLLDAFVIMPNHVHVIFNVNEGNEIPLGQVVRNFKSTSAREIKQNYLASREVWQQNYYERFIRSDRELNLVRLYIDLNPRMWNEHKQLSEMDFHSEEELEEILKPYRNLT